MPLTGLLMPDDRSPLPALTISSPAGDFPPVITETAPGIHAEVVLHGTQPQDTVIDGITVDTQERLLLTTPAGIVRADLSSGALGWAAPIPGCRGSALQRADGSILVICGETVLRWDGHDCQILAGGFTGGTSLLLGPGGQEWVFDYKTAQWMQFGMSVTLTRLGDGLGQEERHTIDFRAGIWSAVWLSGLRFFLAGDGHFGLVDLDNTTTVPIDERLRSPHPDQRGAVRIDEHTVMTATRHGTVYRIDVETGKSTLMARLDMLALGCDLASGHQGRAYVLEHRGSPRSFIAIVVALSGYMP